MLLILHYCKIYIFYNICAIPLFNASVKIYNLFMFHNEYNLMFTEKNSWRILKFWHISFIQGDFCGGTRYSNQTANKHELHFISAKIAYTYIFFEGKKHVLFF